MFCDCQEKKNNVVLSIYKLYKEIERSDLGLTLIQLGQFNPTEDDFKRCTTIRECHKQDFSDVAWKQVYLFEQHFSNTWKGDHDSQINDEDAAKWAFWKTLQEVKSHHKQIVLDAQTTVRRRNRRVDLSRKRKQAALFATRKHLA